MLLLMKGPTMSTTVIRPTSNKDDDYFWAGVADDRLVLRRCTGCTYLQHPPTPMCPRCGCVEWTTRDAVGTGTVYSWIVAKHPNAALDEEGRIVALIDLDEGVRFVANLVEIAEADVRPGLPVELTFRDVAGVKLPQFRPVGEAER
jgi:uncharacterized OB-fold protein